MASRRWDKGPWRSCSMAGAVGDARRSVSPPATAAPCSFTGHESRCLVKVLMKLCWIGCLFWFVAGNIGGMFAIWYGSGWGPKPYSVDVIRLGGLLVGSAFTSLPTGALFWIAYCVSFLVPKRDGRNVPRPAGAMKPDGQSAQVASHLENVR